MSDNKSFGDWLIPGKKKEKHLPGGHRQLSHGYRGGGDKPAITDEMSAMGVHDSAMLPYRDEAGNRGDVPEPHYRYLGKWHTERELEPLLRGHRISQEGGASDKPHYGDYKDARRAAKRQMMGDLVVKRTRIILKNRDTGRYSIVLRPQLNRAVETNPSGFDELFEIAGEIRPFAPIPPSE
jgi:hypothetical protein